MVIAVIPLLQGDTEPVLGRWVGFLFLLLLVAYLYITYVWARQGSVMVMEEGEEDSAHELMSIGKCWLLVVGGLVMIVIGARVLVPAASEIALRFGVPDDVVAATMVRNNFV